MKPIRPGGALLALAIITVVPTAAIGQVDAPPSITPVPGPTAAVTEVAAPPRITLRWTTASELDNYGFFVMRSDVEEGPFKPLHPKAIPGAGNSEMPHKYSYDDTAVEMGRTYFYYVESVSTRGEREKFTPVITKTCCKVPTPTPAEASPASPVPTGSR